MRLLGAIKRRQNEDNFRLILANKSEHARVECASIFAKQTSRFSEILYAACGRRAGSCFETTLLNHLRARKHNNIDAALIAMVLIPESKK
jgi:hypothetical protein